MVNRLENEIMQNWKSEVTSLPLVTIRCTTYNHKRFIEETLDGFLMQKTDFPFEIIVHDDCSTDGTTDIIREYERKYPNIITPIYETENQYSKHNGFIGRILDQYTKGKYIALCEGDDYWCDASKLQKQVDYMKEHPECVLYIHNAYELNLQTQKLIPINPYPRQGILSTKEVLTEVVGQLPPTASMLYRTEIARKRPMEVFHAPVGDRPLRMYLAVAGGVYYSDECMSVYRVNNPNSFTGMLRDYEKSYTLAREMEKFYKRFDSFTHNKYHDEVKMLSEMEYYGHYSRFNMVREIRKNLYYIERVPIKNKLIVELRGMLPFKAVKAIRYIKAKLRHLKPVK